MNCRKCRKLEGAYVDGLIDGKLLDELESHLAVCDACRVRVEQTSKLVTSLHSLGAQKSPVDMWQGVSAKIAQEQVRMPVRPRIMLRLIAAPVVAAAGAVLFVMFGGVQHEQTQPKQTYEVKVVQQHPDGEYLQYVQAYSQFQSQQSLDPDTERVAAELTREKALPGK